MMEEKIILRDYLAIDRTKLANQRTFLAYLRTAIMVVASGITIVKLIPDDFYWRLFGFIIIFLSPLCLVVAIFSYYRVKKNIEKMYQ